MPRSPRPDRTAPSPTRPSAPRPVVPALRAAVALLIASSLLSACGVLLRPRLEVEGGPLVFEAGRTCLRLRLVNAGSPWTTLSWRAEAPDGPLAVSPPSGEIRTGRDAQGRQMVTVRARPSAVPAGTTATGTLAFVYDAGTLELPYEVRGAGAAVGEREPADAVLPTDLPADLPYVPGRVLMRAGTPFPLAAVRSGGGATSGAGPTAGYPAALAADARRRAAAVRAAHGLELLRDGGGVGPDLVRVEGDPVAVAARLEADPRVAYAHPDWRLEPLAVPDDPLLEQKWTPEPIGLLEAWEVTTGADGNEVVLAVLDSGVDPDHEDLRGRVLPGYDVYDDDDDASPGCAGGDAAHGTHVAGIAAATGGNGVGIAGVAPGARVRVLPVKLFDESGRGRVGSLDDLIRGMLWAAGLAEGPGPIAPADVINMSVGARQHAPAVDETAARVAAAGVVLIASAGNYASGDWSTGVTTPANAPDVISVGSIDADGARSYFSDFDLDGDGVDLMAPGGVGPSSCRSVLSTLPGDDYGCMQGTSMAAPVVAGAVALLLTRPGNEDLTPDEVRARLRASARFDPAFMEEDRYGAGVLCVDRLLGAPTLCGEAH